MNKLSYNLKKIIRLLPGSLVIVIICILIQQLPVLLGYLFQIPVNFKAEAPSTITAHIHSLPKGSYYFSLGIVLDDTEIWINDSLVENGRVILGAPFEVKEGQSKLVKISVKWKAGEPWRDRVFDFPVVASYHFGILIHILKVFVRIYLGPGFSLLLILFSFTNYQIAKPASKKTIPHLVFGIFSLIYMVYITLIPDLFFNPVLNTFVQILVKVAFSGAFIFLIGSYYRQNQLILVIYLLFIGAIVLCYFATPENYILINKIQMVGFTGLTGISTLLLLSSGPSNQESILLTQLGIAWTLIQAFGSLVYWRSGTSYLTVWSPSFVAVLTCIDFYLIYKSAVQLSADSEVSKRTFRIASQVSHDIRSPIATLKFVLDESSGIPEDRKEIAKIAMQRIDSIAQDILDQHRLTQNKESQFQSKHISSVLDTILLEKRVQSPSSLMIDYQNELRTPALEAVFEEDGLKRMISNLMNNAAESMNHQGVIRVSVSETVDSIYISIQDQGTGISPDILKRVRTGEMVSTKENGNGLGLYSAGEQILQWGGKLEIDSQLGQGTRVSVILKKVDVT